MLIFTDIFTTLLQKPQLFSAKLKNTNLFIRKITSGLIYNENNHKLESLNKAMLSKNCK